MGVSPNFALTMNMCLWCSSYCATCVVPLRLSCTNQRWLLRLCCTSSCDGTKQIVSGIYIVISFHSATILTASSLLLAMSCNFNQNGIQSCWLGDQTDCRLRASHEEPFLHLDVAFIRIDSSSPQLACFSIWREYYSRQLMDYNFDTRAQNLHHSILLRKNCWCQSYRRVGFCLSIRIRLSCLA